MKKLFLTTISISIVIGLLITSCQKELNSPPNIEALKTSLSTQNKIESNLNQSVRGVNSLSVGLVAYYPFCSNANDYSGNKLNATVYGARLAADRFGHKNNAYSFNGVNNYIHTPIIQNNISAYSVSIWFKTTQGGWMFMGSRGCDNGYGTRLIMQPPTSTVLAAYTILYGADGPAYDDATATSNTYNDNKWHHVAGVWDGTKSAVVSQFDFKIYIDGILVPQVNQTSVGGGGIGDHRSVPLSGSEFVDFGRDHCNIPSYFYGGLLDDIRIYNRALTSNEIAYLATH